MTGAGAIGGTVDSDVFVFLTISDSLCTTVVVAAAKASRINNRTGTASLVNPEIESSLPDPPAMLAVVSLATSLVGPSTAAALEASTLPAPGTPSTSACL